MASHEKNHNLGDETHPDINITTPEDGQILTYQESDQTWRNKNLGQGLSTPDLETPIGTEWTNLLDIGSTYQLKSKTGTFVARSGTGNQSINGLTFQPQVLMLWMVDQTSTGYSVDGYFSKGWTDGVNQAAAATAWKSVEPATRNKLITTACISLIDNVGSLIAEASIVSFNSDGFTINWTTSGNGRMVGYLVLGGTSITDIKIGSATLTSPSPSITDVGFRPDMIMLLGQSQGFGDYNYGGHIYGVAVTPVNQHTTSHEDEYTGYTTENCLALAQNKSYPDTSYTLTSLDSDGFTLHRTAGNTNLYISYLAIKGVSATSGILTQPDASGQQVISTGYDTVALIMDSPDKSATNTWTYGPEKSIGVASCSNGSIEQFSMWIGRDPDADSRVAYSVFNNSDLIISYESQDELALIRANAQVDCFDNSAFTLNWVNTDSVGRKYGWVSLGAASNYETYSDEWFTLVNENYSFTKATVSTYEICIMSYQIRLKSSPYNITYARILIDDIEKVLITQPNSSWNTFEGTVVVDPGTRNVKVQIRSEVDGLNSYMSTIRLDKRNEYIRLIIPK